MKNLESKGVKKNSNQNTLLTIYFRV